MASSISFLYYIILMIKSTKTRDIHCKQYCTVYSFEVDKKEDLRWQGRRELYGWWDSVAYKINGTHHSYGLIACLNNAFSLSDDITILEISRYEIYGGE